MLFLKPSAQTRRILTSSHSSMAFSSKPRKNLQTRLFNSGCYIPCSTVHVYIYVCMYRKVIWMLKCIFLSLVLSLSLSRSFSLSLLASSPSNTKILVSSLLLFRNLWNFICLNLLFCHPHPHNFFSLLLRSTQSIMFKNFEKHGLTRVHPLGEKFDPNQVQALFFLSIGWNYVFLSAVYI